MDELKPCPKCKGTPEPRCVGDWKQYWVFFCSDCGYTPVKNHEARSTIWGAKMVFNKRTDIETLSEKLKEFMKEHEF